MFHGSGETRPRRSSGTGCGAIPQPLNRRVAGPSTLEVIKDELARQIVEGVYQKDDDFFEGLLSFDDMIECVGRIKIKEEIEVGETEVAVDDDDI